MEKKKKRGTSSPITEQEKEYMLSHCNHMTNREIAIEINRSDYFVRKYLIQLMGEKAYEERMAKLKPVKPFTEKDIEWILSNDGIITQTEMAKRLGTSVARVNDVLTSNRGIKNNSSHDTTSSPAVKKYKRMEILARSWAILGFDNENDIA